jgi:hypothetical protein
VTAAIVIGLSAVVMAIRDGEAVALTVRPTDRRTHEASTLSGLPSGPFDPSGRRTFELQLRAFVTEQTGFEIGYVEQLYTYGDEGRDAPLADLGEAQGETGARVVSVGYLALTPEAVDTPALPADWSPWTRYFPWEDWRPGRPPVIDEVIAPALRQWAAARPGGERLARARLLFALDGAPWNEERVLDRYELLYEAGLAAEADRDRDRAQGLDAPEPVGFRKALGEPMVSDHRRILATGLGRLRGKIRYRPVVFELMPPAFTLSALQRTVEAITGVALHKQNFRRMVERTGLVEGLGRLDVETGGRPAELFRFRRERLTVEALSGLSLPALREG